SGWIINLAAGTLTEITDPDFPSGVKRATYQDGFFCVAGDGTQRFYINFSPNVGTSWDGLDFASAEGSPDHTIGIISDHRELWLFGERSAEVWVNTGNSDFPFERSGNAFIEHGCAAAGTIAKIDNTVFWLGSDASGAGIVWRADGYTPLRVSTHAIEKAIAGYTISDATAFTYQQEGHSFYVLTFPTDSKTWVYDAATQLWHERAWRDPSTNELYRWRPACHCYFNREHLVGDYADGRVYSLDLDTYTDDGDPIKRIRATAATEHEQKRVFYNSLTIDMETGVGLASGQGSAPLLMVRWSDDGGHTWTSGTTVGIGGIGVGGIGEYDTQVKLSRL
ncbi:MAG: packaged DNA stabilization protein, partial [Sulfuricaulis sp.]|nr:packaged DNA stabilization protein [Sulfuricaulis sp.]